MAKGTATARPSEEELEALELEPLLGLCSLGEPGEARERLGAADPTAGLGVIAVEGPGGLLS